MRTEPGESELYIDGVVQPESQVAGPAPYYGVAMLDGVPRFTGDPATLDEVQERLPMPEPVTPWIFPFDFLIEIVQSPFVDPPVYSATVVLPERDDDIVIGEPPAGMSEFRARAREAARGR